TICQRRRPEPCPRHQAGAAPRPRTAPRPRPSRRETLRLAARPRPRRARGRTRTRRPPGSRSCPTRRSRCRAWPAHTRRVHRAPPASASRPRSGDPPGAPTRPGQTPPPPPGASHTALVWAEVPDVLQARPPLLAGLPYGLHPHPDPDLGGRDLRHEMLEGDVRAVEEDGRGHVGHLDRVAGERHVHDAERGHDPAVGQLYLLLGGHAVGGARAPGWDVDLAADRAALADELALGDAAQEARRRHARCVAVLKRDRRLGARDRLRDHSGRKASLSRIPPARSDCHRTVTLIPLRIALEWPASTAWSIAVSAPSSRISAQANGRRSGCFGSG